MLLRALLLTACVTTVFGCAATGGDDDDAADDDDDVCTYPDGAVEPMELGEVITPYSWNQATNADRDEASIDLARVFCNEDEIDWSPFDVLLFISFPAW